MATVKTAAGDLVIGGRYRLTLRRTGSERVLERATIEVEPAKVIGHCASCSCEQPAAYAARSGGQLVGFLPENVTAAEKL